MLGCCLIIWARIDALVTSVDLVKGKQIKPLIALLRKEPFIKKNKVSVKKCPKPEKEVIFIKYDKANMRYLYYCCYCDTNWKNV